MPFSPLTDEEIRQWCIERALEMYRDMHSPNSEVIIRTANKLYRFVAEGRTL